MSANHSMASILGINGDVGGECALAPRSRQRRSRTLFSEAALGALEEAFTSNPYPDINERDTLARQIDVTEARIQVWFQNRRSRSRRSKAAGPAVTKTVHQPKASSSPAKRRTPPVKPQPLTMLTSPNSVRAYPLNYPGYMFGYGLLYPQSLIGSPSHYVDADGIPVSPVWSPSSPNFSKFFHAPVSPLNGQSTPLKSTQFPFPDFSPSHHRPLFNMPRTSDYGYAMSMQLPVKTSPLDLSDWTSPECRQADNKTWNVSSSSSVETTSVNTSTSSDEDTSK